MRPHLAALFTLTLLAASPAMAEDSAPSQIAPHADYAEKLDQLFGTLHRTTSTAEAQMAENKIRAIWSHDNSDEAVERLAKASFAMQVGEFEAAENLLNKLVQDHPEFMEAWNRRATLYYMEGKMKLSLADIDKVLTLEPRHFGALSGKGAVLRSMGKNADAMAAMKEAVAIDPFLPGLKDAIQEFEKTQPEL
jgi:tetratricopeptide (TPR) repeat protein